MAEIVPLFADQQNSISCEKFCFLEFIETCAKHQKMIQLVEDETNQYKDMNYSVTSV